MGTVAEVYLYAAGVACALVLLVGVLRARPRELPAAYVQYRPERNPAVILAELEVRQTCRDLAPLYDTPTLSGPPAR